MTAYSALRIGSHLKRWIMRLLPKPIWQYISLTKQRCFNTYARRSYSQEGEDMILDRFFEQRSTGFYVDVGAHHPQRFSNTYRLYRRGWRGLNIDANPGSMAMFQRVRPRDINIEAAVASGRERLTYYTFSEPALNGFHRALALEYAAGGHPVLAEVTIVTSPLWELLDQHLPPNTMIDLLTVDVEGLDYNVLRSNDWTRYHPEFVLVECIGRTTLEQASSDPLAQLLVRQNYSMVAKTMNTVLFRLDLPSATAGTL
jgi:FkbM family methyltransferase